MLSCCGPIGASYLRVDFAFCLLPYLALPFFIVVHVRIDVYEVEASQWERKSRAAQAIVRIQGSV